MTAMLTNLKIRSNRDCTDKIKATCAQVSTECGISIEMAHIAVKTTCISLYGHDFYLCVDDKLERDGDVSQPSAKRPKHPYSKEKYAKYEDVLPSVRAVADYKHFQASQVECDASMVNKKRKQGFNSKELN